MPDAGRDQSPDGWRGQGSPTHQTPHFHPVSGACDCLCDLCDLDRESEGLADLCICPDCNRKCGELHPDETADGSGPTS